MFKSIKERLISAYLILKESIISFDKNNNLDNSAALSYYGFFAVIPLCLLIIYTLSSYIMSSASAIKLINMTVQDMFPEFSKVILKEITTLSTQKKLWGAVGLITLLWSITPLAAGLRGAFCRIFKVKQKSFLKGKIKDFFAVFILVILLTLLSISEIAFNVVLKQLKFLQFIPYAVQLLNALLPFVVLPVFLMLFYITFAPVKLRATQLFVGAMTTTLLWLAIMPVFSLFLKYNPNYGLAFGSLKAVFILIIWVYYAVVILLFGAEVMAAIARKDALILKDLFISQDITKVKPLVRKFVKTFKQGHVIFSEGDAGDEMFFVLEGEVRLIKDNQVLLTVHEGEYFGEMSMLLNTPRPCTAVAFEDGTEVISIAKENFEVILTEYPQVATALLKELATRLQSAEEILRQAELSVHH